MQFIHFVTQKVILQFASHRLPEPQLGHKSGIGANHAPLSLEQGQRLLHADPVLGHQESGHQGGRAGLAVVAVHQHHARPLPRLDEGKRPGEVRKKILARNITDLEKKSNVSTTNLSEIYFPAFSEFLYTDGLLFIPFPPRPVVMYH